MFCTLRINRRRLVLTLAAVLAGILLGFAGINTAIRQAYAAQTDNMEKQEGVRLPIIMYHSMLKDQSRQGQYVISPDTFESDLKYLKAHGYTSVTMQELIDYVKKGAPLPEKPIVLSFDDGYYNNYLYAYPLAKQYGFKIVIAPIGYYTDQYSKVDDNHANYSHLTWDQINEMMASGCVEFQNHTYNLHSTKNRMGAKKIKGESDEHYAKLLEDDLQTMQREMQENTGYTPTTFVYPFGAISNASVPIVKGLGFQATLTCEEKMNTITKDPECLFGLGRYLRPAGKGSEAYFQKIKLE